MSTPATVVESGAAGRHTAAAARAIVTALLRRIGVGTLSVLEDGERLVFGRGQPVATIEIRSPGAWPMLLRGSLGLADAYAEGLWDTPDLVGVIRIAARNVQGLDALRRRLAPVRAPLQHAAAIARPATRQRSRQDIAAHYDLGNTLFAAMLDPTMSYSSALFTEPGMSLEAASIAKLERVCEKLDLGPRDHVVEIGTGWGGFALHAAATRGCRVTTTTISQEQHAYATARIARAGLSDRVSVLMQDYRDLRGRFDKLVSIEMIEAVGWRHFGTFFEKCSSLLTPDGAMLLQAITIDDRAYAVEKAGRSFMNQRIFPGGCLPSLEVIARQVSRRTDMTIINLDDMTTSYVETLRRWRERFLANWASLSRLGYDERFRRLWTLYLAYCEAGFAERRIADVQVVLAKPGCGVSDVVRLGPAVGVRRAEAPGVRSALADHAAPPGERVAEPAAS